MTFSPTHGLWSVEPFDSTEGFTLQDSTKQSVTGGYATLIPQVESSKSFFNPWAAITGWHINNGLASYTQVTTQFTTTGGIVDINDTQSGYQKVASAGGMWEVFTPPLQSGVGGLSGRTFEYISLQSGSPETGLYYNWLRGSSDPFTLEFDVASTVKVGSDTLAGIPSGLLTGLSGLTGVSNHGVYISNGPNWDYLEVRPDGIRSYNHPELAIPINLSQPKRFRVGVRNNDLFILSQDGRGLAGLG